MSTELSSAANSTMPDSPTTSRDSVTKTTSDSMNGSLLLLLFVFHLFTFYNFYFDSSFEVLDYFIYSLDFFLVKVHSKFSFRHLLLLQDFFYCFKGFLNLFKVKKDFLIMYSRRFFNWFPCKLLYFLMQPLFTIFS